VVAMMNKVQITGKMWNKVTALQDKLVLLHNAVLDHHYITWHLSPWIGHLSCTLYNIDEKGNLGDEVDGFTWYVEDELDGYTYNDAIDKITEWEAKYALD
jgi:hypothetical protein